MKAISSPSNPRFRQWLQMANGARRARGSLRAIAEGLHLAQAALDAGVGVEAVLLRRGTRSPQVDAILARSESDIERFELPAALYDRLAPVERGAGIALVIVIPEVSLPHAAREDMVAIDGVQDPGNAGAIIRSAAAAGVRHVVSCGASAALWSPKTLRAGMGAHFRLALHEHVAPLDLRGALDGPWIAAVVHDAPSIWDAPLDQPAVGWVFGGEGGGISPEVLALCDARVQIPMVGAVESLNVAAAAAICLFERRRRQAA
jgi:RNA methyltransferase, TrmH family